MPVGEVSCVKTVFQWEINNFCINCKSVDEKISSPTFFSNNVKWQMLFFPKGTAVSQTGYSALYLRYVSGNSRTYHIKFSFSIIDNSGGRHAYLKCSKYFNLDNVYDIDHGHANFIKHDKLLSLVSNGKLIVNCEIGSLTNKYDFNNKAYGSEKLRKYTEKLDQMHKIFENLWIDKKFTDVKLVIADKEIYAHKNILASKSKVFAAMFEYDMKENIENTVNIEDIDYEVFFEMLRFIYTEKVENMKKMAKPLLVAADMYNLADLKVMCAEYLGDNLTIDNVIETLIWASEYDVKTLKNKAVDFISSNAEAMKVS